jgi:ribonucleoside-diphosphate reductase alpha chain
LKQLRKDIIKYGVRNSLVTCEPPTASSARVIGSNEAFEPFTSNLYVRRVTGGEFAMVNKHLVRELEEAGIWDRQTLNELIKMMVVFRIYQLLAKNLKIGINCLGNISKIFN